jgi:hypothetical protein
LNLGTRSLEIKDKVLHCCATDTHWRSQDLTTDHNFFLTLPLYVFWEALKAAQANGGMARVSQVAVICIAI